MTRTLVVCLAVALGACGGGSGDSVTTDGGNEGSGGSGGGGSGGTPGSGGSGGSGGTSGNKDAAAPKDTAVDRPIDKPVDTVTKMDLAPGACLTNDQCAPDQYCSLYPNSHCRAEDGACKMGLDVYCNAESGACIARQKGCNASVHPVCGCDGKTYTNACIMAEMGVSKANQDMGCEGLKK